MNTVTTVVEGFLEITDKKHGFLRNPENILMIKPKDPFAIAASVKKIYQNYNKYQKNLAIYRKKANWKKSALEHKKLYKAILDL